MADSLAHRGPDGEGFWINKKKKGKIMFVIKYRVSGYKEEFTSPQYMSYDQALDHKDDIAGYEGVEYAVIQTVNIQTVKEPEQLPAQL